MSDIETDRAVPTADQADPGESKPIVRSWAEFRSSGLLWLLNTAAVHPRGYAIAFHWPDGTTIDEIEAGAEPIGWSVQGDGTERWAFSEDPQTSAATDALFLKVRELLP